MISSYQWHNFHLLCNPNTVISVRPSQLLHPSSPCDLPPRPPWVWGGLLHTRSERVLIGPPPPSLSLTTSPLPLLRSPGPVLQAASVTAILPARVLRHARHSAASGLRASAHPPPRLTGGRSAYRLPRPLEWGKPGGRARPESGELEVRFGRRKSRRGKSAWEAR